ncbi:MAG: polymer-forming cytoskeletal protein [Chloroflexota bacterium]|nr:polymer-forming cytoskeletal protein [Chloroflexota bacterium]
MIARRAGLVGLLLPALGIGLLLTFARPALGAEFEAAETRTIAADETIDGSLYFGGQTLVVNGTITGDLLAAGSQIVVNGHVNGSVMGAARSLELNGQVDGAARVAAQSVTVSGSIGRELVVFASDAVVSPGATIGDGVMAAVATLSMDGAVTGDLTGDVGSLSMSGQVDGSVDVEASSVSVGPAGRINGDLRYRSRNDAQIAPGAQITGGTDRLEPRVEQQSPLDDNPFLNLLGLWVGLLVLGYLILVLRPAHVASVGQEIRLRPVPSLGVGILVWIGQIAGLLALCVLAVLFGLLLPQLGGAFVAPIVVVILLAIIIALVAQVYVAAGIGQAIASRADLSPWLAYAAGALVWALLLGLATLVHGALGALLYFIAWFLALGALALHHIRRRRVEAAEVADVAVAEAQPPPPEVGPPSDTRS